jgi:hypothetical protein
MHAGEGSTCRVEDLKTCVQRVHVDCHSRIRNSGCFRRYDDGYVSPKQYQLVKFTYPLPAECVEL